MKFFEENNSLLIRRETEKILIEACGTNALRVRVSYLNKFKSDCVAINPDLKCNAQISLYKNTATVKNGKISCTIAESGAIDFYKDGKMILREYYRSPEGLTGHSKGLKVKAREMKGICGDEFEAFVRFEADKDEHFFGMGQYQQPNLDLKGCVLELSHRNSQISIPFALSSRGYGFMWNNSGIGDAIFGANYTQWHAKVTTEIDYLIIADDTPKKIIEDYTELTGRAPHFPDYALGLWQSKLRYRTQEEALEVLREYKKRNIPLDVLVLDYFHWFRQGEWSFDKTYWPEPEKMIDEIHENGTKVMVSIWPTVDRKSKNYKEMRDNGYLITPERGNNQTLNFAGDVTFFDASNPEARDFVWNCAKQNYLDKGVDMFWLDVAEPEFENYDYDNYRYNEGAAIKVTNKYPMWYAKGFYENQKKAKDGDVLNLVRCAWFGSQKYGTLVWSGDVKSTFEGLRDQISAGLNMGIAGIPWWCTDTGGFNMGNVETPEFKELLIRWYEYSTFSPVLRMHGDRDPHDIPLLSNLDYGGGFCETGRPNELWSYGEKPFEIMKKYLDIRFSLKGYLKELYSEASENGSPIMRTMFYEFPNDQNCWKVDDQYMLGYKYLVAPVYEQGANERNVYLPCGKWKNFFTNEITDGGKTITVSAPLDVIPVFEKIN